MSKIGRPGADGRLGQHALVGAPRPAPTARRSARRGPASGRLLASTTSIPASTRLEHQRRRVVGGQVDQDRVGERVLAEHRQRVGRLGAPPAARVRQALARLLAVGRARRRRARSGRPARRRSRWCRSRAVRRSLLGAVALARSSFFAMMPASARPIWPKPSSTTSRCAARVADAAADLGELERARGPRAARPPRPWPRRRTRCSAPTSPARWRRC